MNRKKTKTITAEPIKNNIYIQTKNIEKKRILKKNISDKILIQYNIKTNTNEIKIYKNKKKT